MLYVKVDSSKFVALDAMLVQDIAEIELESENEVDEDEMADGWAEFYLKSLNEEMEEANQILGYPNTQFPKLHDSFNQKRKLGRYLIRYIQEFLLDAHEEDGELDDVIWAITEGMASLMPGGRINPNLIRMMAQYVVNMGGKTFANIDFS